MAESRHGSMSNSRPKAQITDLDALMHSAETPVGPPTSGDRLQGVGFVESKAETWMEAADGIIHQLAQHGVGRGQVLGIDAHSYGSDGATQGMTAVFSAHYSTWLPHLGPLNMRYMRFQEPALDDASWASLRRKAIASLGNKRPISVTTSCGGGSETVICCFYHKDDPPQETQEEREIFGDTWTQAVDKLLSEVEKERLQVGQILWIDAHRLPSRPDKASLSVHFSKTPVEDGSPPLSLSYRSSSAQSWDELYAWASDEILKLGLVRQNVLSITCSWDPECGAVAFLFYQVAAKRSRIPAKEAQSLKRIEEQPGMLEEQPSTLMSSHRAKAQPNRRSWEGGVRSLVSTVPSGGVEPKALREALLAMAPRSKTASRSSLSEYTDVQTPLSQSSYVPSLRHSHAHAGPKPGGERTAADVRLEHTRLPEEYKSTSTGQRRGLPAVASVAERRASSLPQFSEEQHSHDAPPVLENKNAPKVWCPSFGQLCNDINSESGKRDIQVQEVNSTSGASMSWLPTAAPSPDSSVASFRESGFQVLLGKDIHLDSFGQHMLFSDLKSCKRLCKSRGYGAFVISGGRVFFKQQPAEECQEYLVNRQGCTAYLNATNSRIGEMYKSGKKEPMQVEGEVQNHKDASSLNTAIVQCPVFLTRDAWRCNCQ